MRLNELYVATILRCGGHYTRSYSHNKTLKCVSYSIFIFYPSRIHVDIFLPVLRVMSPPSLRTGRPLVHLVRVTTSSNVITSLLRAHRYPGRMIEVSSPSGYYSELLSYGSDISGVSNRSTLSRQHTPKRHNYGFQRTYSLHLGSLSRVLPVSSVNVFWGCSLFGSWNVNNDEISPIPGV